jgi:hypothetical protein
LLGSFAVDAVDRHRLRRAHGGADPKVMTRDQDRQIRTTTKSATPDRKVNLLPIKLITTTLFPTGKASRRLSHTTTRLPHHAAVDAARNEPHYNTAPDSDIVASMAAEHYNNTPDCESIA